MSECPSCKRDVNLDGHMQPSCEADRFITQELAAFNESANIAQRRQMEMEAVVRAAVVYVVCPGEDPSDWRDAFDALKKSVADYQTRKP